MSKVQLSIEEIEVELSDIDYEISKYYPATMYNRNGDPGDPEEGGFEGVNAVWVKLKDEKGIEHRVDILPLMDLDTVDEIVSPIASKEYEDGPDEPDDEPEYDGRYDP